MAKKYSILVEDEEIIAVEVDGERYKTVDDIPDEDDREKMLLLVESWPGEEWERPEEEVKPFLLPKLIVPLFLAVALLMLSIATVSGLNTRRALAREVTGPGRVVELVERRDSSGNAFYYPLVELILADGSRRTVQLSNGSFPAAHEVGDPVTVAYDPQNPLSARIYSTGSTLGMYTVTIITGLMGLAFAGGTLFARRVMKQEPGESGGVGPAPGSGRAGP